MLTLPILAHLYHRDGRLRFWSAARAYLIVLYFLGLGCFTLYPLPAGDAGIGITYGIAPQLDPLAFIADIRKDGITAVLQIVMNIIFFMPLGLSAPARSGCGCVRRPRSAFPSRCWSRPLSSPVCSGSTRTRTAPST